MKKLVALLVFALAATAFAGDTAWYNTDTQTLQWQRPARVTVNGTDYGPNPHPDLVVAAGWQSLALDCAWTDTVTDWEESPPVRCMTQKEIDAKAEAEAAEIALIGPDPETFVPILDADGEPVGTARLIVDSDTLELVAVINSESPQRTWAEQKADFMAALSTLAARRATLAASRMAIKQTVLEGELSQDELDEIAALWPPWESGVAVAVDEIYSYQSALYRVVQAHTTQADWTPDVTPALFAVIAPPGVIAEWVQPTGGHDAYNTGDRVTHNGHTWVSTVDANVWEPGVYGWTQED